VVDALFAVFRCNELSDSGQDAFEPESEGKFRAGGTLVFLPSGSSDTCPNGEPGWIDELVQKWRAGDPPFGICHVGIMLGAIKGCLRMGTPLNVGKNERENGIHLYVTEAELIEWAQLGLIFDGRMGCIGYLEYPTGCATSLSELLADEEWRDL
jgi:hypothetical protein